LKRNSFIPPCYLSDNVTPLPAIGQSVYTHVAADYNDVMTFSFEANQRHFLADGTLRLFA
jgi:hypothetical protein